MTADEADSIIWLEVDDIIWQEAKAKLRRNIIFPAIKYRIRLEVDTRIRQKAREMANDRRRMP